VLVDYGGMLAIIPALAKSATDSAGLLKGSRSLTKALMAEHAQER